jgi:hypothetical protein
MKKFNHKFELNKWGREKAILYLENACKKFGFRSYFKRVFLILKIYFIYSFPNGIHSAYSQTII